MSRINQVKFTNYSCANIMRQTPTVPAIEECFSLFIGKRYNYSEVIILKLIQQKYRLFASQSRFLCNTFVDCASSFSHSFSSLFMNYQSLKSLAIAGVLAISATTLLAQPKQSDLDAMSSTKPFGCLLGEKETTFRLFAPRANAVFLVFFAKATDATGREVAMRKADDGTWEHTETQPAQKLVGTFYAYRVAGPAGCREAFNENMLFGDPYSRAVATKNTFKHEARTLILDPKSDTKYDWQGDKPVIGANHNDRVIYEAHMRDMTAHPSSGVKANGSYKGLAELGKKGGLTHLKSLGVNAVEFLPLQEFANLEPDFNKYRQNHWGYMTSYFFAPESYYASGGSLKSEEWSGTDGRAVKELKDLVKTLHREKIAVIMDVVYNHASEFDQNPLKIVDKFYYFHTDSLCNYIATSYCGNDFKTNRAMARRLIVESVKYWMTEYHIDGFRFDLAAMIDRETCEEILREARTINPNVVIIAEPWGGNKYSPELLSDIGWASWNDQIRNGVKGQNPRDGMGFIFGRHQGRNTKRSEQAFINGTLREDGGLFVKKEHSVNYLESHDDETMGDFIRLALRENREDQAVANTAAELDRHAKLSPSQLALNKLAALFLFSAQGPVMIHAGQEYARSKVIARVTGVNDSDIGRIDRNSYNKDNATNYLNYVHAASNQALVDYYKGLIALRKAYPKAFGSASKQDVEFLETGNDFAIAFRIKNVSDGGASQPKSFVVVLNGQREQPLQFSLPAGAAAWKVLANNERVSPAKPLGSVSGKVTVPQSAGLILAE